MAVSFDGASVSSEHTTANSVYNSSGELGTIQENDLLIIWQFLFNGSAAPPTPTQPTGFNPLPLTTGAWPMTYVTGSAHFDQYAWFKIASGSESGSYAVTHAATSAARGSMAHVSGNDPITPFSPNPNQNQATDTGTTTYLSQTTTVPGALIIIVQSDDNDTGLSYTPPTGSTPTFTTQVNDSGGNFMASGVLAAAGATGNKTMTNDSQVNNNAFAFFSSMIVVQPALAVAITKPLIVPQGVNRAASF